MNDPLDVADVEIAGQGQRFAFQGTFGIGGANPGFEGTKAEFLFFDSAGFGFIDPVDAEGDFYMQAWFGKAVEAAEAKQNAGLLSVNLVQAAGHCENQ